MIHVLGSINIDYACAVEQLPAAGETVIGERLMLTPGGKGANQAIAARRAGANVMMTGAVGTDSVAEQAIYYLQQDNVQLDGIATLDGPTGCAFVFVDASSENQIVIIPGANGGVTASQAEQLPITSNDILLLQLEVPLAAVTAAAYKARETGARVIANLAPYQALPLEFFSAVDVLLLNETEAQQLAQEFSIDITRKPAGAISTHLKTTVVITLGSKGVVVSEENGTEFKVTGKAINAIDTVGAGDTFAGYLGTMLAEGKTMRDSVEIANSAAALACTKTGAQSAIPTIAELKNV